MSPLLAGYLKYLKLPSPSEFHEVISNHVSEKANFPPTLNIGGSPGMKENLAGHSRSMELNSIPFLFSFAQAFPTLSFPALEALVEVHIKLTRNT